MTATTQGNGAGRPVFDAPAFLAIYADCPDVVVRLVEAFEQAARDDAAAILDAWGRGDVLELRRRAHRLRGAALQVAALAIGDVAAVIEDVACDGVVPAGREVASLALLLGETLADMRRLLPGAAAPGPVSGT